MKIADVTVNKIIAVGGSTGKLPMVVSGVTMSEDKKTASVSLFSNFENGANYEISVKGYDETITLTAFVGKPVSMTISSKSGIQNGMFVTINTVTELTYSLFDEQGNDVTNTLANTNVFFTAANYNVNDYYVSGRTIYIFKEGVQAAVNAEFHTADGKITATGYFVGIAETPITLKSAELIVKRPWANYTNNTLPLGDCSVDQHGTSNVIVEFKVQTTHKDDTYAKNYNDTLNNSISFLGYPHTIEFRSSNPDVADVIWAERYGSGDKAPDDPNNEDGNWHYINQDGSQGALCNKWGQLLDRNGNIIKDAKLRMFKEGTTAILADIVTYNADGSRKVNTVASTYITVGAARAFQKIEAFGHNGSVLVGTDEDYCTETITFLAKDQYGDCLGLKNFTYTFADGSDASEVITGYDYSSGWKSVFTVDGSKFDLGNATAKQFYIKVKCKANDANAYAGKHSDSDVEFSFVVEVRKEVDSSVTSLSIQAWNTMDNGTNVGRYNTPYDGNSNTENAKKTTFKVFQMNNGIKVGQLNVAKKTATTNPVANNYYYTVERNGIDITSCTDMVDVVGGKDVVLNYSKVSTTDMIKKDSDGNPYATTGSAVGYYAGNGTRFAEGNYVFTLYKAESRTVNGITSVVCTVVGSTSVSATYDTESYTFVKRTSEYAQYTDNTGVTHCVTSNLYNNNQLKTVDNQVVLRNCFEIKDRSGNSASAPYFVNATYSDRYINVKSITFYEEFNGVYAPYTVNINVSLLRP